MSLAALIDTLAGTPRGALVAAGLALTSAVAHAGFGALQKGRHDPWLTRGAIDLCLVAISAPLALWAVPWPAGREWAILIGAAAIHFLYKLTIALAYARAPYTVVYPVMRGSGPLLTVAAAALFLGESYAPGQWLGVGLLSAAMLALAALNLARAPRAAAGPGAAGGANTGGGTLRAGLGWALAGDALVAVYTAYDAWGIRATPDPFTFLAWFFLLSSLDFPVIAALRWRRMAVRPVAGPLLLRGLVGALVALVSFGGVMLATRLAKVGEAAALRETSVVFAALIGHFLLREHVGARRAALMVLIAAGAVIVQVAG